MVGSNENHPALTRPLNNQGGLNPGLGKFAVGMGKNRRALSTINSNIIGAYHYPCANNKRAALSENNGVANKIPAIPAHRPITRKFAAQMASKHRQPSTEELKKPEDCILAVDEYKASGDSPVPMFVKHTEAMMNEIDQMEVEMENARASAEIVIDIDSGDERNELAVVEYVDDLYAYYKKVESLSSVSSDYMAHQFDINDRMRAILIDWLIEVHYKFELMAETLYLTVNLIDRFLSVQAVVRKKLQLVGVTAMLLACKYEEVSVPVVEDLILMSDKAYSRKEVLEMEKMMVNRLQFNMSVPTPYVFMRRFLKAAQSDNKLEHLSFYIIELCLVEYEMLKFPPSLLAAAAVFTSQCTLSGFKHWSRTSEKHSKYSKNQLMECSKMMVTFHQKAATGKLTGVYRKYNTSKYCYAAKLEAAHFLLEDRF